MNGLVGSISNKNLSLPISLLVLLLASAFIVLLNIDYSTSIEFIEINKNPIEPPKLIKGRKLYSNVSCIPLNITYEFNSVIAEVVFIKKNYLNYTLLTPLSVSFGYSNPADNASFTYYLCGSLGKNYWLDFDLIKYGFRNIVLTDGESGNMIGVNDSNIFGGYDYFNISSLNINFVSRVDIYELRSYEPSIKEEVVVFIGREYEEVIVSLNALKLIFQSVTLEPLNNLTNYIKMTCIRNSIYITSLLHIYSINSPFISFIVLIYLK